MNSQILLLGNGFDLYHELPTKYDNFLHTVQFLLEHFDDSINTIGDVWSNDFFVTNDSFISNCYSKHKNEYDSVEINRDKVKSIIKTAKTNLWFKYLSIVLNKDIGWIDFEKEIIIVLEAFKRFLKIVSVETSIFFLSHYLSKEQIKIIDYFNYFYNKVKREMPLGLTYTINANYLIKSPFDEKIFTIKKEQIVNDLYKDLLGLSDILKLYLDVFINDFLDNNDSIKKNAIFNKATSIISFNYTNTYQSLYSKSSAIAHVHGTLNGPIVLGVNPDETDEIESMDTTFICFKKYYQRIVWKTDAGYRKMVQSVKLFKSSKKCKYDLCVAGHSLDITDKDIIIELFELATNIVVLYHDESAIGSFIKNLITIYGKRAFDRMRIEKNLTFEAYDHE